MGVGGSRFFCLIMALVTVIGCQRIDPLEVQDNGAGTEMEHAMLGLHERLVCIKQKGAPRPCGPKTAQVYVRGLGDSSRHTQMYAHWREGDPKTVEVFVFGGTVARCRNQTESGEIRLVLKQATYGWMPSTSGWKCATELLFGDVPNSCGGSQG